MFVTIQTVSQEFASNGAEYKKVTGITGDGKQTTKNVFDNLKDKWDLLIENKTVEFVMEKKGQFWNVVDIKEAVASGPTKTRQPIEGGIAPEELGMWYKEIGLNYRAGKLEGSTGKALMTAYWARMFTVVGIEKEKSKQPKELAPEDIPF